VSPEIRVNWAKEWENVCHNVGKLEQLYYEQEGTIGYAIERIITEDDGVDSSDSSDESSDMSGSDGLSGVEELEED
jgi:hypothetical protein